jgi:Holliday junction resolvasome RuvABC endonuclease subunit
MKKTVIKTPDNQPIDQQMMRVFAQLKDLMNRAEKPKHRKKIAAEMTAFHKWLDEYHPADPKIEVSAVENKV